MNSFANRYRATARVDLMQVFCITDPNKPEPQRLLLVDYYTSSHVAVPLLSTPWTPVLIGAVLSVGAFTLRGRRSS